MLNALSELTDETTTQDVYDFVARALLAQGKPSGDLYPGQRFHCKYRAEDGSKCAAGQLIPDSEYDPTMEGRSVNGLIKQGHAPSLTKWVGDNQSRLGLLRSLQCAHDDAADYTPAGSSWLEYWREKMRHVAEAHGLSAAVLAA